MSIARSLCVSCFQTVTGNERITFDGGTYHKSCFICSECSRSLCDDYLETISTDATGRKFFCAQHGRGRKRTPTQEAISALVENEAACASAMIEEVNLSSMATQQIDENISKIQDSLESKGFRVVKIGYLTKQGAFVKNWKKRIVVLTVSITLFTRGLLYFKPNSIKEPKGAIDLSTVSKFTAVPLCIGNNSNKTIPGISLFTAKRIWLFGSENERDRDLWLQALHCL